MLFSGLTNDQLRRLHAWQKATEEIADIVAFGELVVKFHQARPVEYELDRKLREGGVVTQRA